jgi:hypothetical protein
MGSSNPIHVSEGEEGPALSCSEWLHQEVLKLNYTTSAATSHFGRLPRVVQVLTFSSR